MAVFIIRRVLLIIPTLLLITVVTFGMVKMAPGDPLSRYIDPNLDPAQLEVLRHKWGLNDPIPVQYLRWAGNFFTGDFGVSLTYQRPVLELIVDRLPATLLLTSAALLLALLAAIPMGIAGAVRPNSLIDNLAASVAFFGLAMPNFWLGLMMIALFSVHLGWLPSFGMQAVDRDAGLVSVIPHLILPAVVLGTRPIAVYTRYTRAALLDALSQDYIRTARAKGLRESVVLNKHALKNALSPILTLLGLELPFLISGSLVVEQIFGWPGLGWFTWRAVMEHDYPLIMGMLTAVAFLTLLGNLLADVSYALVDPRIRYD